MKRFAGRVVLISGTGGGQGRVAAHAFAQEGARVVGCDVDVERSRETTKEVIAAGGEMISLEPLDLGNPADAERWVQAALDKWGQIDVLYNNAAGIARASFEDATVDHWNYTLRNELTLGFVATRAVWPHLVRQKHGVIVSVASVAGYIELAGLPFVAHGVANAGVQAMARLFAAEGAPHGIRSVSISPGIVHNPYQAAPFSDPSSPEMTRLWGPTPLGRPAKMEEVIKTALFLASDDASFITGEDVLVDGGLSKILWRRAA